jgi:hypothetical protein
MIRREPELAFEDDRPEALLPLPRELLPPLALIPPPPRFAMKSSGSKLATPRAHCVPKS